MNQKTLFEGPSSPPESTSGGGKGTRWCPGCQTYFRPYNAAWGYQKYCSAHCRYRAAEATEFQETGRDAVGRLPAEAARDKALEKVAKAKFREEVLAMIEGLPPGSVVTGEDIRLTGTALEIKPHHPNAWGAVVMHAIRKGMLEATGEMRKPKTVKSHARKIQVYRRK